eukprot:scaffold1984_cov162-Amphora_coffeaeformis.AAC.11
MNDSQVSHKEGGLHHIHDRANYQRHRRHHQSDSYGPGGRPSRWRCICISWIRIRTCQQIQHTALIEGAIGIRANFTFFAFEGTLGVMRGQTPFLFATVEIHIVDRGTASACQVECGTSGMVFTGFLRIATACQENTRVGRAAAAVKPFACGEIGARSRRRVTFKSQIIIRFVIQAAIQKDTRFRGATVTIQVTTVGMRRTLSEITLTTIQIHIVGLRVRSRQ